MRKKLYNLKEVVCCIIKLKEKNQMGIHLTLSDMERIPKFRKIKVK